MNARRSERLRRKRQLTAGVSQPGAYTLHNNAYVVESEASFLPSTPQDERQGFAAETRRNRYRNSPHRYPSALSMDESPIMPSSQPNYQRKGIANQVRTSLFDILGSAARRPVTGKWTATPNPKAFGNFGGSIPPEGDEIIPSDEEDEHLQQDLLQRQLAQELEQEEEDDLIVTPAQIGEQNIGLRYRGSRREIGNRQWRGRRKIIGEGIDDENDSRLALMSVLSVLMILPIVIICLNGYTSSRGQTKPISFMKTGVLSEWYGYLRKSAFAESRQEKALEELRAALAAATDRPETDLSGYVTREELSGDLLPKVLEEARRAAREEAVVRVGMNSGKDEEKEIGFEVFKEKFAADKGLPADYALGSAGGKVIGSTPGEITIFGRFIKRYVESLFNSNIGGSHGGLPRRVGTIIEPGVLPGNCWAFDGEKGSVTIRLARPVGVNAITIEHTPKTSVFNVTSAPKEMKIYGVREEEEEMEVLLGKVQFKIGENENDEMKHIQSFKIGNEDLGLMRTVRFEFLSNHGAEYTCVYRLRVHGKE